MFEAYQILSYLSSNSANPLLDPVNQKLAVAHHVQMISGTHEIAFAFDGIDSHISFGNAAQFYGPNMTLWTDVIVEDKAGEQHIYGHFGRDTEDYWCNAQFMWNGSTGELAFRVGADSVFSINQSGFSPQRYRLIGRIKDKRCEFWVNGTYLGDRLMLRDMSGSSSFGLWAGQRDYIRYGSRTPFKGKLFECGLSKDTSDTFINLLIQGPLQPSESTPVIPPATLNNELWTQAEAQALDTMFQLGKNAVYEEGNGNVKPCQVFIDVGWRDDLNSYESHPAEYITQISVLLNQITNPRKDDVIKVNNKRYLVVSIQSEDDYIAVLSVKHVSS